MCFVTLSELFYPYLALYEYGYNLMTSLYDLFILLIMKTCITSLVIFRPSSLSGAEITEQWTHHSEGTLSSFLSSQGVNIFCRKTEKNSLTCDWSVPWIAAEIFQSEGFCAKRSFFSPAGSRKPTTSCRRVGESILKRALRLCD